MANNLLLIGRIVLSAVFGVAGIAKLADLHGSRKSLVEFGVPRPLRQRRRGFFRCWSWPAPSRAAK